MQKKNIVITGSAAGLGACLTEAYLKKGMQVFGIDKRKTLRMHELQAKFADSFIFLLADVRESASVKDAAETISQHTGHIDILYNNAGILPKNSENMLEDFDVDASLDVFSTNALGPLRMVKQLMPLLKKGNDKIVINISSEAGSMQTHCDYTCRYDYCMSKAALNIQSIILQRYVEDQDIKVYAVHPGWMKTEMGGPEAPILPEHSARGIIELVDSCRETLGEQGMFFDYDGSPRAW